MMQVNSTPSVDTQVDTAPVSASVSRTTDFSSLMSSANDTARADSSAATPRNNSATSRSQASNDTRPAEDPASDNSVNPAQERQDAAASAQSSETSASTSAAKKDKTGATSSKTDADNASTDQDALAAQAFLQHLQDSLNANTQVSTSGQALTGTTTAESELAAAQAAGLKLLEGSGKAAQTDKASAAKETAQTQSAGTDENAGKANASSSSDKAGQGILSALKTLQQENALPASLPSSHSTHSSLSAFASSTAAEAAKETNAKTSSSVTQGAASGDEKTQKFSAQLASAGMSEHKDPAVQAAVTDKSQLTDLQNAGLAGQTHLTGSASPSSSDALDSTGKNADLPVLRSVNLSQMQQAVPELAERVTVMVGQKLQQAELELQPHGLGKMNIQLSMDQEQKATVHFVVQPGAARELVEQALPKLKEMLNNQGIQLGQTSVEQQSAGQQQAGQQAQRGESAGGGNGQRSGNSSGQTGQDNDVMVQNLAIEQTSAAGIDFYA